MIKHKETYDERYILNIIPKINNWESIPYAPDLLCQECGEINMLFNNNKKPPTIIGWCETDYGYQLVFECPYCFSKYRYHPGDNKFNIDEFVDDIMYKYVGSRYYTNGLELERQIDVYELSQRVNNET